jgi:hypothetical protein
MMAQQFHFMYVVVEKVAFLSLLLTLFSVIVKWMHAAARLGTQLELV